jgi:hypothetical protein
MAQDPLGCLKRVEAGETLIVVRGDQRVAEIKPPSDPFDQPLPYGEAPQLTAPDAIGKSGAKPRWAGLLAALAAQNIWVEVDNVCAYLDHFPDVAHVLVAIAQSTRKEFGPEAKLTLEINRDPEIDDKYLLLRVVLTEHSPDVMERIRAVAAAHEDQLWDKKGHILLMPDYPRIQ